MVGMEVRGRDTRYGGGCIDCVRLVQREEIQQNRERTNREMRCRCEERRYCEKDSMARRRKSLVIDMISTSERKQKTEFIIDSKILLKKKTNEESIEKKERVK